MSIDLQIFDLTTRPATQQLMSADDSGQTVTGMQKLCQRFILELLTETDSVPGEKHGCDFVQRLTAGVSSESDVFITLHASIGKVVQRLRAAEQTDDPDDEVLAGISVGNLEIGDSTLGLNLTLKNNTGQRSNITVPLNFILR